MKIDYLWLLVFSLLAACSSKQYVEREHTNYRYFDKPLSDALSKGVLLAITDAEHLQYGSRVAFVDEKGDTVIPFGKYAYYGTDTLEHYANVLQLPENGTYGRRIAIDRAQNILYDIVTFEVGPDPLKEGLVRVLRNGMMGFANQYGQVTIPCIYEHAWWFEKGKAKVAFKAKTYLDKYQDHFIIESDEWFYIDKKGREVM